MRQLFILIPILGLFYNTQEIEASGVTHFAKDFSPMVMRAVVSLAETPWEKVYPKSPYDKIIVAEQLKNRRPGVIMFGLNPLDKSYIDFQLRDLKNYFSLGYSVRPTIWLVSPREGAYLEEVAEKLSMANLLLISDDCGLTEDTLRVDRFQPPEESRAYILDRDGNILDCEPQGYRNPAAIFGRWVYQSAINGKH